MSDISLLAAFLGGILALLSPCSALLLPSFFAYAFSSRFQLLGRTLYFYIGLLVTLVPLGMGATFASRLFYEHRPLLILIAGWFIIALGVLQLLGGSFAMPFAQRLQNAAAGRGTGPMAIGALGAVYGLAGFCSGPVLGAILTLAATKDSPLAGGGLLAVYALGMAAPLFVLAALWDRFDIGRRGWLRGRQWRLGRLRLHSTAAISGLLFIAIGVLFLRSDGTAGIAGLNATDLEYRAQLAVSEYAGLIPLWALPLAIAMVAAVIVWRRSAARRSADKQLQQGGHRGQRQ